MRMRRSLILFLVICLQVILAGCSSHDVADYRTLSPNFDLFGFFKGKTWGRGIVFDRSGRMTRQFIVAIDGTSAGDNRLLLDEQFRWNDGERTSRIWTIDREHPSGAYTGSAADVRGTAEGAGSGNSFNWQYTLALKVDGSTWNIGFDDWMFLQEGNILFNRAVMSKFGFTVGEVFIVFSKEQSFGVGLAQ